MFPGWMKSEPSCTSFENEKKIKKTSWFWGVFFQFHENETKKKQKKTGVQNHDTIEHFLEIRVVFQSYPITERFTVVSLNCEWNSRK